MSRALKFRVWDSNLREMANKHNKLNIDIAVLDDHTVRLVDNGWYELMQFTGLLDKNGKEIYEGDVLLGFLGTYCTIEWDENRGGWTQFLPREDFEIIGNIYENPELTSEPK